MKLDIKFRVVKILNMFVSIPTSTPPHMEIREIV
jgi:hypothetical protein